MSDTSENGRIPLYIAAAGGVMMLLAVLLSLFDGPGSARASSATVSPTTVYVTRLVRARNAPTAEGSAIVAEHVRGETLTGQWVTGADGETQWLKVSRDGQEAYVWGKNLSPRPRPDLGSLINANRTISQTTGINTEAGRAGTQIDILQPGVQVSVVGTTGDGELEVELRQGGVGYIPASAVR